MQADNSYILWLASWYPNKLEPFNGDFVQRQAKALAAFTTVHVLHIVRDKNKKVTASVKIEELRTGNLIETIIYYAIPDTYLTNADRFFSMNRYKKLYKKYLQQLFLEKGLPAVVHVHVPYKAGLTALWIKKKFGIDYFVTEHWAGYSKENPDNFFQRPYFFRFIVKKILSRAKCIVPVSEELGKKLRSIVPGIEMKIVPNTVDCSLFYFNDPKPEIFRFLHYVSPHKNQKNTEGLLKALGELRQRRDDWECMMYGLKDNTLIELAKKYELEKNINFTGEIIYKKVAELVRAGSAFVSFSNYENQPCTILEALCCGLPVIATKVGGIPEII
ncbi:MAG TPA: glycosyltransferase, partial [Chitinophagaceae bacterium]|nr:glycosyltransferase [Chitinophagaceae bacterium]